MEVRLQKIIAQAGISSRRRAETLILSGRISVNGRVVRELGSMADIERDEILFDGKPLPHRQAPRVIMLHKPVGYLCACRQGRERGRLITELIPADRRYFPIGRLDRDTSGLLLLTDDGELAFRLAHPRHVIPKEYVVETAEALRSNDLRALQRGMQFEEGAVRLDSAEAVGSRKYRFTLTQGRKRQIRRMIAALGNRVVHLHRTRIADLDLGVLPVGHWRELSSDEINNLLGSHSTHPSQRREHVPR